MQGHVKTEVYYQLLLLLPYLSSNVRAATYRPYMQSNYTAIAYRHKCYTHSEATNDRPIRKL